MDRKSEVWGEILMPGRGTGGANGGKVEGGERLILAKGQNRKERLDSSCYLIHHCGRSIVS